MILLNADGFFLDNRSQRGWKGLEFRRQQLLSLNYRKNKNSFPQMSGLPKRDLRPNCRNRNVFLSRRLSLGGTNAYLDANEQLESGTGQETRWGLRNRGELCCFREMLAN